MKLLFDANLSPRLAAQVQTLFPGSLHVHRIGALGAADELIWEHARLNDFMIVSKDSDFHHMSLLFGAPPKVAWLRVGNAATADILRLLVAHADAIERFQQDEAATLLIVE